MTHDSARAEKAREFELARRNANGSKNARVNARARKYLISRVKALSDKQMSAREWSEDNNYDSDDNGSHIILQ